MKKKTNARIGILESLEGSTERNSQRFVISNKLTCNIKVRKCTLSLKGYFRNIHDHCVELTKIGHRETEAQGSPAIQ